MHAPERRIAKSGRPPDLCILQTQAFRRCNRSSRRGLWYRLPDHEPKSIGADVVYAWPNATIGMMDASAAAKIMYADEIAKADDSVALINEKAAAYREMQSSALAAAKRGYVDDIIEACDTRKRVIAAFEMLFTKREDRPDRKTWNGLE